jgi:hypothetical protein
VLVLRSTSVKAVADGAVAWYIAKFVKERAARYTYGTGVKVLHDSSAWWQTGRRVFEDIDGDFIYGIWGQIVAKVSCYKILSIHTLLIGRVERRLRK